MTLLYGTCSGEGKIGIWREGECCRKKCRVKYLGLVLALKIISSKISGLSAKTESAVGQRTEKNAWVNFSAWNDGSKAKSEMCNGECTTTKIIALSRQEISVCLYVVYQPIRIMRTQYNYLYILICGSGNMQK